VSNALDASVYEEMEVLVRDAIRLARVGVGVSGGDKLAADDELGLQAGGRVSVPDTVNASRMVRTVPFPQLGTVHNG
jgi:hypothetical protein